MIFADIDSMFYQYIRGAILILCIYNILIYSQNKNKQFLYYSLYFLFIFLFFLGQEFNGHQKMTLFHILTPSIHCGTFIFYLSFARQVLNTPLRLPEWDIKMLWARKVTLIMVPVFILLYYGLGRSVQGYAFYGLAFATFLFTLLCYYHFYKIKSYLAYLFLVGSFSYSLMAICSFFAGFSFGGYQGFIDRFGAHPTIFMYCGSLFEAVIFSVLIGNQIDILQKEKKETLKQIDELKRIVIRDYIVLKDKTKIYIADLMYIKSDDHYLNLFLSNGKNHFVRGKLKAIKKELPPNFLQSHRSYIVNTNFVKQSNADSLVMANQKNVPLSRSYKDQF